MNSLSVALVCTVLLVVQQTAMAINCYACTGGSEGCGASSFSKTGAGVVSTADSTPTYCKKTITSSNANYAVRDFASSGTCSGTSTSTSMGNTISVYCCTTDLCNSAPMIGMNIFLAIGTAMIGLFLVK